MREREHGDGGAGIEDPTHQLVGPGVDALALRLRGLVAQCIECVAQQIKPVEVPHGDGRLAGGEAEWLASTKVVANASFPGGTGEAEAGGCLTLGGAGRLPWEGRGSTEPGRL